MDFWNSSRRTVSMNCVTYIILTPVNIVMMKNISERASIQKFISTYIFDEYPQFAKHQQSEFKVIVLCEIGARNISTVENLFLEYDLYYVLLQNNMFGGVGIYLHRELEHINVIDELKLIGCYIWKLGNLYNHLIFATEYYGVINFTKSQKVCRSTFYLLRYTQLKYRMFYNRNNKKNAFF